MEKAIDGARAEQITYSPRLRRAQWTLIGLLLLSGTINYLDRSTLSIGNPMIREEMGLSLAQMGVLLSAFSWSYALAQLPAGGLVDRIGPRILLSGGLFLWSLAQMAGGFVQSFAQFIWARIFLGVGESPQFPTAARVVSTWFHVRDRGLPTGFWNCASTLGPAISPPILTALMLAFGWRAMFIIMGAAGIVAAVVWYLIYRNPREAGISEGERRYIVAGDTAATSGVVFAEWRRLFRFGTTWGMIFGFFGTVYLLWLYLTWLPGYLEIEHHMSTLRTGFAASIPFVFGFFGALTGGAISDWLGRRGFSPINSRKYPIVCGLLGMALFTVPAALTHSADLAIFFIAIAMFFGNISSTTSWALVTAVAPPNYVASLGSIQNFGGYFGGSFAPIVTGLIAQHTHSFAGALIVGAGIGATSAMIYLFAVTKPIPGDALRS
jgi:MFS family permease